MATKYWMGNAELIAQVDSLTPANVEIGDIFTAIFADDYGNTISVSFTATAATVANVTAGLTAAINGSGVALVRRVVAEDMTTYIKLTAASAGRPFTVTTSTTDGGGVNNQTLTRAAVTASSGPNDRKCAANWSGNALPGAGDDIVIAEGSGAMLYNLDASGTSFGTFTRMPSCTGAIGRIEDGRLYYLKGTHTGVEIYGGGSLVALDLLAAAIAPVIDVAGALASANGHTVYLKGSAITTLDVRAGSVGLAVWPGDTATVTSEFRVAAGADLEIGSGVTVAGTTAKIHAASVTTWASVPTVVLRGQTDEDGDVTGAEYHQKAGYWTTLTAREGSTVYNYTASASYGSATLYDSTIDSGRTIGAKTYNAVTLNGNSSHYDPLKVATITTLSDQSNQPLPQTGGGPAT